MTLTILSNFQDARGRQSMLLFFWYFHYVRSASLNFSSFHFSTTLSHKRRTRLTKLITKLILCEFHKLKGQYALTVTLFPTR